MTSPDIPRSVPPAYIPNFPRPGYTSSPRTSDTPISPPKTRSASADEDNAALIEDWRLFTKKIREQARGERNHLLADRARADEVMEEERQLWEQERNILKARISQLETEVLASKSLRSNSTSTTKSSGKSTSRLDSISASGSNDMSPSTTIPQSRGRNEDGTPFYAPRPTNPSRSFDSSTQELRIDSISEPGETPIRVTSKSLRPVDFGIQSPERAAVQEVFGGGKMVGESIDISLIQPTLDGVAIKTSAVDPIFAATVLSPQASGSPSKRSPMLRSPSDERGNSMSPPGTVRRVSDKKIAVLEMRAAPENRRLTLHAGHTPNHSITKFDLGDLSGNATPRQSLSVDKSLIPLSVQEDISENAGYEEEYHDEDRDHELIGPLGFSANPISPQNDTFARELVKRLSEEALRQQGRDVSSPISSPNPSHLHHDPSAASEIENIPASTSTSLEPQIITSEPYHIPIQIPAPPNPLDSTHRDIPSISGIGSRDEEEGEKEEGELGDGLPRLKMKASVNFGRPFGVV